MSDEKLYHVVAVSRKNGRQVRVTATPCTLHEATVIMGKFTVHPQRYLTVVEASRE